MKKLLPALLITVFLAATPHGATGYGIYWIGNSLMSGGWGCYEGWDFVGKAMINPDSTTLGLVVHSAALKRGATDIPAHYQADLAAGSGSCTGIGELNAPTGCITYGYPEPWCATQGQYDYVILQGYRWTYWGTAMLSADTEYKYCSLYYDLGLSNGTKPIVFACWQNPSTADTAIAIYDSLYRKYKSRGAIYAPVIQAHRLVWKDPAKDSLTYLYAAGDPFHHTNFRGGFLMACVFYEVFTGRSPAGITLANLKRTCTNSQMDSMTAADISYLEDKAHQAVVNYYGTGKSPHLGMAPVGVDRPVAVAKPSALYTKSGTKLAVDLAGHTIIRGASAGMRVAIAANAAGGSRRVVMVKR